MASSQTRCPSVVIAGATPLLNWSPAPVRGPEHHKESPGVRAPRVSTAEGRGSPLEQHLCSVQPLNGFDEAGDEGSAPTDLLPPGLPQRTPPLKCPETEECNYICPCVTPFSGLVPNDEGLTSSVGCPTGHRQGKRPGPDLRGSTRAQAELRGHTRLPPCLPTRKRRKSSPPRGESSLQGRNTSAAASSTTTTSKRCAHACVHTEQHNKARERGNSGAT
ncbi:unnamed protein product [Gadus morhua 'NCC']